MGKKVRSLALYGFIGAVFLIGFSVLVLNHYWTELGINPKTERLPQITKDYEEFKDYTTLLIALISASGTILSSFLIILFYDAWKDQHNKNIDSIYYQEAITSLKNVSTSIHEISRIITELELSDEGRSDILGHKYETKIKKYLDNLSNLQGTIIFIDLIEENNQLEKIVFNEFIKTARERIEEEGLEYGVMERMDYDSLFEYIKNESTFHGNLIKNNIKTILKHLNGKIKA